MGPENVHLSQFPVGRLGLRLLLLGQGTPLWEPLPEVMSQRPLIWDKGHQEPWIMPHRDHKCSCYFSPRIPAKPYPENNQSQGRGLAFEPWPREPVL